MSGKRAQRPPDAPGAKVLADAATETTDAPRTLTVTLPLPDRKLCGNGTGRANGFQRARLVKAQRQEACILAALAKGDRSAQRRAPLFPTGRVLVAVLMRRDPLWAARRLDDDNLIRGLKAAMDGLTDAGVWADDRQVQWGAITWGTAQPYQGCVVLTLTEVRGE